MQQITKRLHGALGQPLEITLHDLRWGFSMQVGSTDEYVWVLLIRRPQLNIILMAEGSHGYRQPAMYFPKGGSTLHGVAKPGTIIWSRIYIEDNRLKMDIGLAGPTGFEPATPCTPCKCATRLRYGPTIII